MRFRIPPLLLTAVLAAVMYFVAGRLPVWHLPGSYDEIAGVLLVVSGIVFAAAGVVSFRRVRTTVNPIKVDSVSTLVTTGVYRISRNPMYVGFCGVLSGWAVLLGSVFAFAIVLAFFWYLDRFQIAAEEKVLAELFGERYTDYCSKVRRWL